MRQRLDGEETTLYRLYSGPRGAAIERFGNDLLFSLERPGEAPALLEAYRDWAKQNHFAADRIFLKIVRTRPGPEPYALLAGAAAASRQTVAMENGLRYRIDFGAGYACGFFIDQRENRRFLRALRPETLFNGFAYTCSFSVAAAAGGAMTTSADVAPKALAWGKENFTLNGLPTKTHRFWPDDVRDALRRQEKRGAHFGAIVLDPPTFARTQDGKVFRVAQALPELTRQAVAVLAPGGHLLLSTNCQTLSEANLAAWSAEAAKKQGRRLTPVSVPAPADFLPGEAARTLWLRAED